MYSVEWKRGRSKTFTKSTELTKGKLLKPWEGLRVGRYRVFFNVHEQIEIVMVEEVKKRDERTY
jgi:mRNA-degrading endonuclease RelE of RelBE toxin-antitoxin system